MDLDDKLDDPNQAQAAQGGGLEQKLTFFNRVKRTMLGIGTSVGVYKVAAATMGTAVAPAATAAAVAAGFLFQVGNYIGNTLWPGLKTVTRKKSEYIAGNIFGLLGYGAYFLAGALFPGSIIAQSIFLAAGPVQTNNILFLTYNYLMDKYKPVQVIKGLFSRSMEHEGKHVTTYTKLGYILRDYVKKDMKWLLPLSLVGGVAYKYGLIYLVEGTGLRSIVTTLMSVGMKTAHKGMEAAKFVKKGAKNMYNNGKSALDTPQGSANPAYGT